MAIAGPTYLFDYFDIGGFGRQSDGGTWAATEIGKALREDKLILPELKALGRVGSRTTSFHTCLLPMQHSRWALT